MNRIELRKLFTAHNFLITFKFAKQDELIEKYFSFINLLINSKDIDEILVSYVDFIEELNVKKVDDFAIYAKNLILKKSCLNNENSNIQNEINILNNIFNINFEKIKEVLVNEFSQIKDTFNYMPNFISSKFELTREDFDKPLEIELIENNIYTKHNAFIFDTDFEIKPVEISENIKFSDLKGYKEQKKILYENTLALIQGKKVNNILLYGDAGCGKSSSVRALLNEFSEINIIQIFKNNLINLDKLYTKLRDINQKFIIFADDISFDETDATFSTMKAVLEGSLIQCPSNVAIYATSNRRHLVKENFKARMGDEIHLNDTINEINSLSERFGISLLFSKPSNDEFNNIVIELANDNGLNMDEKVLIEKAQRLALIKGSRSPRVAKQLIDNLVAHVNV